MVNRTGFADYSDWMIPSVEQLSAFCEEGISSGSFPGPFQNIKGDFYWSCSSEQRHGYGDIWYENYAVHLNSGSIHLILRGSSNYVWLVGRR